MLEYINIAMKKSFNFNATMQKKVKKREITAFFMEVPKYFYDFIFLI